MPKTADERQVVDQRQAPFCFQTHDALDAIRAWYGEHAPGKLTAALGIYLTFTEAANRNGGHKARGGFTAYRADIAVAAGVSVDTLDRYVRDFETVGVLAVDRHSIGRVSLPNQWSLTDPPSRTDAATPAAPVRPNARDHLPNLRNPSGEEPPVGPPTNRPGKVDGRPVTDDEYAKAIEILAAFNGIADTGFSGKEFVAKIVMRIRERPELTVALHALVIARAFDRHWWKGAATPSVVYGNGSVFEAAVEEARGAGVDESRSLSPEELETMGEVWGDGTPYASLAEAIWASAATPAADVEIEAGDVEEVLD